MSQISEHPLTMDFARKQPPRNLKCLMFYCKEKRKVIQIFCQHFISEAFGIYIHQQNSMAKTHFSLVDMNQANISSVI